MLIVKVKKFGVVWYIPFEMTAKSASGRSVRTPSLPVLIGLRSIQDNRKKEENRKRRGDTVYILGQ
jgi:hypothetical protein